LNKIPIIDILSCPKCNERMDNILQFKDITPSGLALYGRCPKCGERMSIAELWRKTEEIESIMEI